uniref:Putative secreted protein n=1 Tax=Ixodes ricinus TaxID=34613 RepID=A0A6B0V0K0_IXORI
MPVVALVSVSVCCLLSFQEPLCRGFFAENVLRGLLAFFTGDLARCCGSCGMQENFTNENLASGRVNPRLVGWGIRLQRPILVGVTARPTNRRSCATSPTIPRCCASQTGNNLRCCASQSGRGHKNPRDSCTLGEQGERAKSSAQPPQQHERWPLVENQKLHRTGTLGHRQRSARVRDVGSSPAYRF